MIVSRGRYTELTKDELSALQGFLLQYNLRCGISICFHELVKMSDYYNQALKAVLFGTMMDCTQVLYWYEDYAIFHVVDAASQCGNLLNFFHPALLKLLDHDQKSHTNYASSLKAYLESERNIVLSASILHIHRNTMVYRIGKIEEITGIDFQDSSLRLHFLMSFKMLDYMKICGKTIQAT
jgi:DNA-binding PucR family transcriptional regulator